MAKLSGQEQMHTDPINKDYKLDFDRIEYLLNPDLFDDKRITIVGLGSGGAPVCDHLTMNGIRLWDLYDPDILETVNLVKHPRLRKDLGKPKVEIQKNWILDRNPKAHVYTYIEDVLKSENFVKSVNNSTLVLCCPDKKGVREFVNDVCVKNKTPCITASVFRTGIGGEIFAYIPDFTGCYRCLQLFSINNNLNITDETLELTDEERHRIYGLDQRDFIASGLSIDIQTISLIQVRMTLSVLLREISNPKMQILKSNWLIYANRPSKGIFRKHFEVKQFFLKPQIECLCQNL